MLSYRHAFHAGNHADVLKHTIEIAVLEYQLRKDRPFWYIDTHAGAGIYRLDSGYAAEHGEYDTGVSHLIDADDAPALVQAYIDMVRTFNTPDALTRYPGSAAIAAHILRDTDMLWLYELHPTDYKYLAQTLPPTRRIRMEQSNGLDALKRLLPPTPRRSCIMIDPPYELDKEYRMIPEALSDALRRFATGTYMVWYPLLTTRDERPFLKRLHALGGSDWLDARLCVRADNSGRGMYGSGMFVINPPWTLKDQLEDALPYLQKRLGAYGGSCDLICSQN